MADENTVDEGQETVTPAADPVPVDPMLVMLKVDLGISTTAYDERLGQYLTSAKAEISGKGYTFSETLTIKEKQIIVRYAGWKYKVSRGADSPAMPDDIRYCIHDMVCGQKMGGGASV